MNDKNTPRAIALGYFDGVHLGHKALMDKAVLRAKEIGGISSVFTFDQHPSSVMSGLAVPMLTAKSTRADEIKQFGGVDEVIFGHFDDNLRTMDWKDFIHELLIKKFNAKYIISGHNNRFGYKGLGTPEGMAEECKKAGIGYDCIPDVKVDGITVSSTYIRQLISQGEMEKAIKFLGHPYTVSGVVEHGRKVGTRTLGVPTLNLALPKEMVLPPYGVALVHQIVLTDREETPFLWTIGYFIDRCPDKILLEAVKKVLIPIQMCDVEAQPVFSPSIGEVVGYMMRQQMPTEQGGAACDP